MWIGIFITVLFAVGQASEVDRCQLDGENACRDYSTAERCHTTNYCKAEIWSQPINKNENMCQMCITDVTNLRTFIIARTTRKLVKYDLLALCKSLPTDEARTECTKTVDENFNKIYQEIVEHSDPNMICRALYICRSQEIEEAVMKKIHQNLAMAVPWLPKPVSENDICSTEQRCHSYSTAKKCGVLSICKTYVWSAPTKADTVCDMCKQEFEYLQNWAKNPNTKSLIKKDLLLFCDKIPLKTVQQECHSIVDEDFDVIYDDIVSMLNPGTMCSALGLCKAIYSEETPQTTCELDGNNACLDYSTAAKCKTFNYCKAIVWSKPVQSNKLCDACLADVGRIQKFVAANSTKEFVQAELLAICKLLPWKQFRYKCQTMVISRFEEIYDDIVSLLDPKTICRALFFCRSKGEEDIFSGLLLKLAKEPKATESTTSLCALDSRNGCYDYSSAKKCGTLATCKATVWSGSTIDDDLCEMCKREVQKLQNWIKQGTTKAAIEKDLMDLCNEIPFSAVKDECKKLVTDDFDMIYDDLIALLDPSTLCTAIRLCTQVSVEKYVKGMMGRLPSMLQGALDNGNLPVAATVKLTETETVATSCSDCEAFMRDFQNTALNNKKVLGDWLNMLKTECQSLDEGLANLCEENIEMFVYSVMTRHQNNNDDPKAVCQHIMMCNAFTQKQRVGDMCTDCKTFFTDWQEELKNNPEAIDQIVHAVSAFYCLQKPEHFREQCTRYVSMVIKVLIEQMERENVGTICKRLEFCSPLNTHHDMKTLAMARKVSKPILQSLLKPKVEGEPCPDCKNFITDLQGVIKNNQSLVQELVDLVKQQCDQLGAGLSEICRVYVDDSYQSVLDQFAADDVQTICTTLDMCSQSTQIKRHGGDLCTDCVAFFGDWQTIITNNKSIITDVSKKAKDAICSGVPEILKSECDKLFDEDCGKIINAIKNNDPKDVCAAMYFCGAKSPITIKAALIQSAEHFVAANEFECQSCKFVIEEVENMIENNRTEEAISNALENVCELYGEDIRDDCKAFIQQYGADIIDFLLQELNSLEICTKLGLCENALRFHVVRKEKEQIPIVCGLCEEVMEYVDSLINYNSTEKEIMVALNQACDVLPVVKADCHKFVNKYGKMIVDLILKELTSPLLVCEELLLCSKSPSKAVVPIAAKSPIACEVCEEIMRYVDSMINYTSTEKEIMDALDKACDSIPKIKPGCRKFVDTYGKMIVDLIFKELTSPLLVCKALTLCSQPPKPAALVVKSPIACEVCEEIMRYVDSLIDYNSTEKEIMDALNQACDVLPVVKADCHKFVDKYGKMIVDLILKDGTSPLFVCKALLLCSKSPSKAVVPIAAQSPIACEVCEEIMRYVDSMINYTSTEKEIMDALDKACDSIPKIKPGCRKFVDTYGKMIVDLILKELTSPLLVCKALMLCSQPPKPAAQDVKLNLGGEIECDFCTALFTEVDKILDDKATEKEILDAIAAACSYLGEDKDKCNAIIHEYGPAVIEMIVQELNPNEICAAIKACVEAKVKPVEVDASSECTVCQLIATELDNLIKENSTEAEIEKALEEVCSILPSSYKTTCDSLVEEFGSTIVELLAKELAPNVICVQLKLCSEATTKAIVLSDDTECEVCKLLAMELDKLVNSSSTEADIEKALESICNILPSSIKDTCNSLVTEYGPEIVQLLIQELAPDVICKQLQLCTETSQKVRNIRNDLECDACTLIVKELDKIINTNSTEAEIEKALEEVCGIIPDANLRETCDGLVVEFGPEIAQLLKAETQPDVICAQLKLCPKEARKVETESSSTCDVCTLIADELDQMLKDKPTQDEIVKALDEVCGLLPSDFKDTCDSLVQQYRKQIIDFLVNEFNPKMICVQLKLCPKSKNVKSEVTCELCEIVMGELDTFLERNSTQVEITKFLEKICSVLTGSAKNECTNLITQYGDTVIDILLEVELTPAKVCPELGICPASHAVSKVKGVAECDICQVIVQELDVVLDDKSTKADILNTVSKICDLVPKQSQAICQKYINAYGPAVINILIQEIVPSRVCAELHACVKKSVKHPPRKLHVGDEKCSICKEVITVIDNIIKDNVTVAALDKALEQVCNQLPESLKSECDEMVDEIGPMLAKYIDKIGDPAFICEHMKLCPTDLGHPKILGGDPCTYGPSYWCKDLDTARSCNAVTHCMNHVW